VFNGYCGELFVINFILFVLCRFRASLLEMNHLLVRERALFDNIPKSLNSLLAIMILVSSANNMGGERFLLLEGGHLCRLREANILELTLGDPNVLLFPV
jgi:hypothetical protein